MNGHRDPVDSALDALRTERWSAAPFTTEQENRLMQQAQNQSNHNGFSSRKALVALVAVIAVGGVAFAATDGVSKLRTWLFDVEIAPGHNAKILVEDGQTGTMIIEEEDGTTTEITARATELEDGGTVATVSVLKTNEEGQTKDAHEVIRRREPAPVVNVPLEVLKDAEFLADWSDDTERTVELFAIAEEDSEKAQLYVVIEGFEQDAKRQIHATPTIQAFLLDVKPAIDVDESGLITINFDAGDEVAVFKFATVVEDKETDPNETIQIDGSNGKVSVRVVPGE